MGLLDSLATSAQELLKERRSASEQKQRNQDEGWAHQFRLRRELKTFARESRQWVTYVSDRDGNDLCKFEAGLFSPKRRSILSDMNKIKIATLKEARIKGIGVRFAVDVSSAGGHIGRIMSYKASVLNGLKIDTGYYFEPFGFRLDTKGGISDFHYEITDEDGVIVGVVYLCRFRDDDWCKLNFNDPELGLYLLCLLLARSEMDD